MFWRWVGRWKRRFNRPASRVDESVCRRIAATELVAAFELRTKEQHQTSCHTVELFEGVDLVLERVALDVVAVGRIYDNQWRDRIVGVDAKAVPVKD